MPMMCCYESQRPARMTLTQGCGWKSSGFASGSAKGFRMPLDPKVLDCAEKSAALLKAGDRAGAAAALQEALAIEPKMASWHCDLAVLCQTTGQLDEAAQEYRRAVECDSALRQAWYNLGCLLNEQDREAEGLECFQQAVRLAAESRGGTSQFGPVAIQSGKHRRSDCPLSPSRRAGRRGEAGNDARAEHRRQSDRDAA